MQNFTKTKEYSRYLGEKVVEMLKSPLGIMLLECFCSAGFVILARGEQNVHNPPRGFRKHHILLKFSQSSNLILWQYLKNLLKEVPIQLPELSFEEEWAKLSLSRCTKLQEAFLKRLAAVIVAHGAFSQRHSIIVQSPA